MFSDKIKTLKRLQYELKEYVNYMYNVNNDDLEVIKVEPLLFHLSELYDEFSEVVELIENLYYIENFLKDS